MSQTLFVCICMDPLWGPDLNDTIHLHLILRLYILGKQNIKVYHRPFQHYADGLILWVARKLFHKNKDHHSSQTKQMIPCFWGDEECGECESEMPTKHRGRRPPVIYIPGSRETGWWQILARWPEVGTRCVHLFTCSHLIPSSLISVVTLLLAPSLWAFHQFVANICLDTHGVLFRWKYLRRN